MAVTGIFTGLGSPAAASRHAVRISFSKEDYPSGSNVWSTSDDWDKFVVGEDNWIVRPPAAELKLVLEELSPGLDGWMLQRLNVLADKLIACGNEEDPMVRVCQEMQWLLGSVCEALEAFGNVVSNQGGYLPRAPGGAIWKLGTSVDSIWELRNAIIECGTVFKVRWALTWVETLLLEHAMLRVRGSEEMQDIRDRWEKVHLRWPPKLERTKWGLGLHRRLALLSCGQETEAVENFEAPDFWKGFEACFLCFATSRLYHIALRRPGRLSYGYGLSELEDKCVCWAQRAERVGAQKREHWPLVRVRVLLGQLDYLRPLTSEGQEKRYHEVLDKAVAELKHIDLQLQLDFPVPLPEIQFLKLKLNLFLRLMANHRGAAGWEPNYLDHGIRPEVYMSASLDVLQSYYQSRYACACLVLHGEQLIVQFGQVKEGLEGFDRCLDSFEFKIHGQWLKEMIIEVCVVTIANDIARMGDLDRVNRIRAFLVAHRESLEPRTLANFFVRNALAVCGFSGPATFLPCLVPALNPNKAVLEAFWESYKDTCAALSQVGATGRRYEVNKLDTGEMHLQVVAGSWIPFFYLFHVHAVAATVSNLLPPNAVAAHGHGEIARQALLSVETARNYRSEYGGIGPHINWERIERALQACGPGAVFVHFAGLTSTSPLYPGFRDVCTVGVDKGTGVASCVCIVVQDGGVASCHRLDRLDSANLQELVSKISDACLERKLESESCKNALETLYDLLIWPLFHNFIRNWDPHCMRKLVISAVDCFKDVPFSILLNRLTGCYLFQEAKLAFTPSFLSLDDCRERYELLQERSLLAGPGAAVALGDPHYLPYQDDPLPGSRKEVDAICDLFHFCHSDYEIVKLLGGDATVERLLEWVKKPSGEGTSGTLECTQAFIHMAAHGSGGKDADRGTLRLASSAATQTRRRRRAAQGKLKVVRDEAEAAAVYSGAVQLSGLSMLQQEAFEADSAAEGSDFFPLLLRSLRSSDAGTSLQLDDIWFSPSKWWAYMVVLSACNTGVGVALFNNFLDVMSFSRAFMTAGVPCSILAQWAVDDTAAVNLMPLFYEALSQGEDACSALQSAMIKMHQTGQYTLHQIAPFVVTGLPTVRLPPQMRRCPELELASSISKLQV